MAYNPVTGDDDYFDPNDPDVISGGDVDQQGVDPMAVMAPDQSWNAFDFAPMNAPAMQQDPAQNFNQAVLGGRQDSQKDAAQSNDYAANAMSQMMMSMNPAANPFGTGTGKSGLGALDPRLKVQQQIMTQSQPMGRGWTTPVAKALAGFNMSNTIGNQKQAMGAQNATLAQIYASNLSPMQKALLAARMGDKTMAAQFSRQDSSNRQNQGFQDRHQKAVDTANTVKVLGEQAYRTGYLDTGKLYRLAGPVQAYLEQVHPDFDIQNAKNKVLGMQQTTRALNSPQQQRLRQAIQSVKGGIPELQKLSNEFQRTNILPANKFIMGIRQNGIDPITGQKQFTSDIKVNTSGMSSDQVAAAARFKVQVATMRDEIAQVFSGGYAPSESGFKLADEVLNEFYGGRMTRASLEQLMTNLEIREAALYTDPMNPNTAQTNNNTFAGHRTVVRTGKNRKTGKKVTEYSDGTREEV